MTRKASYTLCGVSRDDTIFIFSFVLSSFDHKSRGSLRQPDETCPTVYSTFKDCSPDDG